MRRHGRVTKRILVVCTIAALASCLEAKKSTLRSPLEGNIGLDLDIINGKPTTLTIAPELQNNRFYINQLRLQVNALNYPGSNPLEYLKKNSEFSVLDWSHATTVEKEAELARDGKSYTETSGVLQAAWMDERVTFKLEFLDDKGALLVGPENPVTLTPDHFFTRRLVAMSWANGLPKRNDYGVNTGVYTGLVVTAGGRYTGKTDDVFLVKVTKDGLLDAAEVDITSYVGEAATARKAVIVENGRPLDLTSTAGPYITFYDPSPASTIKLVKGDSWVVHCTAATGAVVAVAGTKATFGAQSEIRYTTPRGTAPVFAIPAGVKQVRLTWSQNPSKPYTVPVALQSVTFNGVALDYGLRVETHHCAKDPKDDPARCEEKKVYSPGDKILVSFNLYDRAGHRLHKEGFLPTYREFIDGMAGTAAYSGVLYYKTDGLPAGHGFYKEHRINIFQAAIAGPKHLIEQPYDTKRFFSQSINIPDNGKIVNPGAAPGSKIWDTPIPNYVTFELPTSAKPGTYMIMVRTARRFLGQVIYTIAHTPVQVGTEEKTDFQYTTGNCDVCHIGEAAVEKLRHGSKEEQLCIVCHYVGSGVIAAQLLHRTHFLSTAYLQHKNDCSLCHLGPESNLRASIALCGSCHTAIHPEEFPEFEEKAPYDFCGSTCHSKPPAGHIPLPPL
jgi:hypothetical protein